MTIGVPTRNSILGGRSLLLSSIHSRRRDNGVRHHHRTGPKHSFITTISPAAALKMYFLFPVCLHGQTPWFILHAFSLRSHTRHS
jgi:hypothetical protein